MAGTLMGWLLGIADRRCCAAACMALGLATGFAQNPARRPAESPAATRALMIQKGHVLEARGRSDLAVQVWQQILLSDPKNAEALAGMARDGQPVQASKPAAKPNQAAENPSVAVARQGSPLPAKAQPATAEHVAAEAHSSRESERQAAASMPVSHEQSTHAQSSQAQSTHAQSTQATPARPTEANAPPAKPVEPEKPSAAHVSPELAAFAALHAKRLDEAERRFTDILENDPKNARAAAGMGQVLMEQNNFTGAIPYLESAEAWGDNDASVAEALTAARFSSAMADATEAANANRMDAAAAHYQQALAIRPNAPEAVSGFAALLMKQQRYAAAQPLYEQLATLQPASEGAWRGLFLCDALTKQNDQALDAVAHMPTAVKAALARDPEYLHTLAAVYQAADRADDAQRVLAAAVKLPAQQNAAVLQAETKFEYAALLMDEKRYEQAAALYAQLVGDETASLPAWLGLVDAHHRMGRDELVLDDVKRMPAEQHEAALKNVGFLTTMGAVDEQAGQLEAAQGLLERAAALESVGGRHPTVGLELQLARIQLARGHADTAYEVFRQSTVAAPERTDAWRGLIFSLTALRKDDEAARQIALIPEQVKRQLDGDIGFVETEASLYAFTGDTPQALDKMARVKAYFAGQRAEMPAYLAVEYAQLMFNAQEDRGLYGELTRLSARADLTEAQRATERAIWAEWSVRRAAADESIGVTDRADDILAAALLAFPENAAVRKAMAESLVRAGRAHEALALYKTIPMESAPAAAFDAAISMALAANDKAQAALWLRQGLPRFPRDATLLALAGRYEQSLGETDRAADYFRAALAIAPALSPAAMPLPGPATGYVPAEKETAARPAVTAADLPRLLDPANDLATAAQTRPASPAPVIAASNESASAASTSRPSGKPAQVWPPVDAREPLTDAPIVVVNDSTSTAPIPARRKGAESGGPALPLPHIFPSSASQGVSPAPVFVLPSQ